MMCDMSETLNCPTHEGIHHGALNSSVPPGLPYTTYAEAVCLPPGVSGEGVSVWEQRPPGVGFRCAYRATAAYDSQSKYRHYYTA